MLNTVDVGEKARVAVSLDYRFVGSLSMGTEEERKLKPRKVGFRS